MLDSYSVEILEGEEIQLLQPCAACGVTLAPSGVCLEIGQCVSADHAATRGATRTSAKYAAAPAAWTARGMVD